MSELNADAMQFSAYLQSDNAALRAENDRLRAQVEEQRGQMGQMAKDWDDERKRAEELTRERDRQRGAAEKHYAVAEDRLVQLERAEQRAEQAAARVRDLEGEREDWLVEDALFHKTTEQRDEAEAKLAQEREDCQSEGLRAQLHEAWKAVQSEREACERMVKECFDHLDRNWPAKLEAEILRRLRERAK